MTMEEGNKINDESVSIKGANYMLWEKDGIFLLFLCISESAFTMEKHNATNGTSKTLRAVRDRLLPTKTNHFPLSTFSFLYLKLHVWFRQLQGCLLKKNAKDVEEICGSKVVKIFLYYLRLLLVI